MISEKQAYEIAKRYSETILSLYNIGSEYVFSIMPSDEDKICGLVMDKNGKNIKKIPMYTLFEYDDAIDNGEGQEVDIKQFKEVKGAS